MRVALAAMAIALAACSPAAAPNSDKPAAAKDVDSEPTQGSSPYFGTWTLADARVAPWWDKKGDAPAADPAIGTITFAAAKSSGPPILTCDKPKYTVSVTEPRGLFEGGLPDADATAKSLGFDITGDITSMNFSCAAGDNDVSLDFPMLDANTIMLGLDNMLYTFKRSK